MQFTKQDIDLMFEAIEVWEREDKGPGFIMHMMSSMVGEKSPESAARLESELKIRQQKADDEKRMRKERGVMLRAKLITMRDSMNATQFCSSMK